ncbi:MAG: cation-translocating P-type ATPase [Proteobacteria bacterium]|nr:cation-translocating P-type ATPase [Pseudomonadota bacterium]
MQFSQQTGEEVLASLNSRGVGLTSEEVRQRLLENGHNVLETGKAVNPVLLFLNQFKSFIIYILLFAVVFSLIIGEYVDSILILAILLANALIGFFQELNAYRSLEALKKITALHATVLRAGERVVVHAADLVPGDILVLEAGDKVPADARLLESVRLKVEESALTGESVPAEKNNRAIPDRVQIGDQQNMLFSSTSVVAGNGRAVVVATGMETEIGRITTLITNVGEEMTPLQRRLHRFGKRLGIVILGICFAMFCLLSLQSHFRGTLSANTFISFLFIAIAMAVAAVPTALPAVVTIALSVGVKRLLKKKALVRRLSSVETLGSCDVICTDKTGTLTENQMTVRYGWTLAGEVELHGTGYEPAGEVTGEPVDLLFRAGILCNNASLRENGGNWELIGDPTEGALLTSAGKLGLAGEGERIDEIPFDSERKMMSVLIRDAEEGLVVFSKGAPGNILERCDRYYREGEILPLDQDVRAEIEARNDLYARQAMRVLAFAWKVVEGKEQFDEDGLVFLGFQAMIDPPRKDVLQAIKTTSEAGIRVIMVTGDYQATAKAIGKEIGIEGEVCSGQELDVMDEAALIAALTDGTNIFARVIPEHKQRIVTALQKMGHTVAMTGDGVNDAPALKKADIGIAVGSGTEVAKEASDFVLLDDSFSHIVNAIREGRGIYDNIQKSIMLLLSGNFGEVLIIFLAVMTGMNLPLTAILLLWINMITDGAPALAFSVDPYGTDIMSRKPKVGKESILPLDKLLLIGVLGSIGTGLALLLFLTHGGMDSDSEKLRLGQTMVFNFVVLYEVVLVFVIRRDYQVPLFSNRWVWAAAGLSIFLQFVLMYTPLRDIFKIVALNNRQLIILASAAFCFYLLCRGYTVLLRFIVKRRQLLQSSEARG